MKVNLPDTAPMLPHVPFIDEDFIDEAGWNRLDHAQNKNAIISAPKDFQRQQFHLTHMWDGKPMQRQDLVLWVRPRVMGEIIRDANNQACRCRQQWEAIGSGDSQAMQVILGSPNPILVCSCLGRILE